MTYFENFTQMPMKTFSDLLADAWNGPDLLKELCN